MNWELFVQLVKYNCRISSDKLLTLGIDYCFNSFQCNYSVNAELAFALIFLWVTQPQNKSFFARSSLWKPTKCANHLKANKVFSHQPITDRRASRAGQDVSNNCGSHGNNWNCEARKLVHNNTVLMSSPPLEAFMHFESAAASKATALDFCLNVRVEITGEYGFGRWFTRTWW